MKKLNNTPFKFTFILFPILVLCSVAAAQSLPGKQEVGLRAPATLKIDGKASEWDGQMKAYNKSVDLYYTIANDDDNLYLVVQATKPRIIEKLLDTGVTFIVNNAGKKTGKAKENISVSYPVLKKSYVRGILVHAGDKDVWSGIPAAQHAFFGGSTLTRTDSTVALANKALNNYSKLINVQGVKALDDTLISVYNDTGIKAAAQFDNKGVYTYELAIPLKYLGLSIVNPLKFSYSIKLNNADIDNSNFRDRTTGQIIDADTDLDSTTEFWADYTLVKK